MINRTTRLRFRRRIKRHKLQVEDISQQADEKLEKHFFKRLERLYIVRRFISAWVGLVLLLTGAMVLQTISLGYYYQSIQPVAGGVYTEGVLGTFTNANPLYATTNVDKSLARLVFAGLLTYDQNNNLTAELAQDMTKDDRGTTYTVRLKPNLAWQDGKPLTSADVVFTYQTIQNPDADSPLLPSWRGVQVSAPDPQTVVFVLPAAYSSFPHSLTTGIVPKHLLDGVPLSQLRSVSFNTTGPVGAGSFKWDAIEVKGDSPANREERIGLVPNPTYVLGHPKLSRFIVRAFHDQTNMVDAFKNNELTGMSGLTTMPAELSKDRSLHSFDIPFTGEVLVFFKTTQELLGDVNVRRALVKAIDTNQIISNLGFPVIAAREPLLNKQIGHDANFAQFAYNPNEAKALLDGAGWQMSDAGVRRKDGKVFSLQLHAQNTDEYRLVTQHLKEQWKQVGVSTEVILESESEFQANASDHNYDLLLSGIAIGNDPDVFAYWHSSQIDPVTSSHLNFSEYKSNLADQALEAGRSRDDTNVRAVKYREFLQVWRDDAPALALYQPRFLYITKTKLFGYGPVRINSGADRFNNVHNWMILQRRVSN
ncbi:hypothetical protein A3D14_03205 [Candidatus Saccharibacteria bacterium RIFCSPHIGHO2_02_FULL_47_12]|nr:MAG: hypothetical protein A3D14_03205 [Candidatus Saccharibacteria bacterium RIFCSPHIGHO2_02_FULL_47_12]